MGKRFVVKTSFPDMPQAIAKLGVDEGGDVQKRLTDEIFARIKAYVPEKTGVLRSSGTIETPTRITYDTPYARSQFFGVTREGVPFDYQPTGPKVGSHWDRRLVADEGEAIVETINRYVRQRGGR